VAGFSPADLDDDNRALLPGVGRNLADRLLQRAAHDRDAGRLVALQAETVVEGLLSYQISKGATDARNAPRRVPS
jgi:hypothetical protein